MRHLIEGYRWMWGAIRRWRGGPLWFRTTLFCLYVLRDVFATVRRTAVAAGLAVAVLVTGVLTIRPDARDADPHAAEIGRGAITIASQERIGFAGQWIPVSELGTILEHHDVEQLDVTIEPDVTVGVVHDVQEIMTAHHVKKVRVSFASPVD